MMLSLPGLRWSSDSAPDDDSALYLPTGAYLQRWVQFGCRALPQTAYSTSTSLPASSDVPPGARAGHAEGGESGTQSGAHPATRQAETCASASAPPGPDPYRRQTPS